MLIDLLSRSVGMSDVSILLFFSRYWNLNRAMLDRAKIVVTTAHCRILNRDRKGSDRKAQLPNGAFESGANVAGAVNDVDRRLRFGIETIAGRGWLP